MTAHTYDPCSLEDCRLFRIGLCFTASTRPTRQKQGLQMCKLQFDEVSKMRQDDTEHRKERGGAGHGSQLLVLALCFTVMCCVKHMRVLATCGEQGIPPRPPSPVPSLGWLLYHSSTSPIADFQVL